MSRKAHEVGEKLSHFNKKKRSQLVLFKILNLVAQKSFKLTIEEELM